MPATVNDIESAVIRLVGVRLLDVGISNLPSTLSVPNPNTLLAIAQAMAAMKVGVATFGVPTDEEVARVPEPYLLAGLAAFFLLEAVLMNWTEVSETIPGHTISTSDLLRAVEARIAVLRKQYGRFLNAPVVAGTLRVNSTLGPATEF